MLTTQTRNKKQFFSCFDNLQHYSNYLTRHSDMNIICRPPVCHHAAIARRNQSNTTWAISIL